MQTEKHGRKLFIDAVILRAVKPLNGHCSESMQNEKRKELNISKRPTNTSILRFFLEQGKDVSYIH